MRVLTNNVRARESARLPHLRCTSMHGRVCSAMADAALRAQWVAKYRRNGSFTGRASYGCAAQRRPARRDKG